ncbi:MAG: thioredoxin [Deltaproteobacteria bacterium]
MALELTDSNFKEEIIDFKGVAVVDFWAVWCGPCKMIGPIIEEMATQFPQVKVGKLDVDSNPDTSVEYGIRSIPTVLFLKDGQIVERHVGTGSKTFFFEKVESLLK